MARRRKQGRKVAGILLLDKPLGQTSNHALQRVKHLFQAAKAGHTGSLDPLATGLLPICLGHTTKFSGFLLDADKRYRVRVRLGETTATADAEGEILERKPTDGVTEAAVRACVERFLGDIEQLPPMYSAVKHQGQRLYKLAREGREVERQPRVIRIHRMELTEFALPDIELDVHCSKGTYVRTLAEDIGHDLGCGGHVVGLRRTGVGPYIEGDTHFVTMDELLALAEAPATETQSQDVESAEADGRASERAERLERLDAHLLSLDTALGHCPALRLSADAAFYLAQGQPVLVPQAPTEGLVRLYDQSERFLGVGSILDDGRVQPKRLV
ncbi:tRNA pseudouridine(55) synthase TruB [Rhabdochromatium marinum]|uniref:tRNA pseudouridine(55) synthase TruB n=1 Tax=Rhabdochromatium marinum TaxID=48729 RepID=UPI001903D17F|nr:tRNA pseudouridine(55) synthase TruB [Rhabdochromatium marinum]MBK1647908.1 tRNA pseudouridine(55) synthase TruB [Rhabdochromatium marinum]